MNLPRIIIAGTHSGCGKTTAAAGIMGALAARGLKVQPYKIGPDYIDPMFHTFITGNASGNLDSWLLDEDTVSALFAKRSGDADIAVVEGVMGLYDGYGGYSEGGSTAHVAKILKTPVILVINGDGMSLSIAALIKGFLDFDRQVSIQGVILNNLSGEGHFRLLKGIIQENLGVAVIGYLKRMPEISLADRHLGLVPEGEVSDLQDRMAVLTKEMEETLDLNLLTQIAAGAPPLDGAEAGRGKLRARIGCLKEELLQNCGFGHGKPRIAVAMDKAFNFYYRDNLDLLEALGAELAYFSPMRDPALPEEISGLYLGGGYPEVWAGELSANTRMRICIREAASDGLPVYAECGGLMYLSDRIIDGEGRSFEMAGVIPGTSRMTNALQRFGYVELEAAEDTILTRKGSKIKGHEFHFSVTEVDGDVPACFKVVRGGADREALWYCGYKWNNVLAGYPHLHFWSNPEFAAGFVQSCIKYAERKRHGGKSQV